jgi:hypothetical protein
MVGWITVSKEKIAKEFDWKIIGKARRAKIQRWLDCEVEDYSQWMQGNCYYWNISNASDEVIAQLGGYTGADCHNCALEDGVAAAVAVNVGAAKEPKPEVQATAQQASKVDYDDDDDDDDDDDLDLYLRL